MTDNERYKILREEYLSEESLSRCAYRIWQEQGCPDGEAIDERLGWKIKDVHWFQAINIMDLCADMDARILTDLEILAGYNDLQ